MIKKLVFFSFAFIFLACNSNNDDDGTNCTDQFVYGLSITVRDAVTEQIISEIEELDKENLDILKRIKKLL